MPYEQEPYCTFNSLHCTLLSVSHLPASFSTRESLTKAQKHVATRVLGTHIQDDSCIYLRGFEDLLFHNYNRYRNTKHISGLINSRSVDRTSQVLDICTLGGAAEFNSEIKFLPHSMQHIRIGSSDCIFDPSFFTCVKLRGKESFWLSGEL